MKRAIVSIATTLSMILVATSSSAGFSAAQTKAASTAAVQGIEKVQSDASSGMTEYRLKSNGLQVLLAERHSTPIVTVMVVYHVGSRNEAVGFTGSTHFLEHMMFRGTKEHDPLKHTGIDDVLKPIGGLNNATTSYDRTNYYELVPAQYLGTCLELEADRMRNALLRQSDRDSEMTVVRNELERNEDDPTRLLDWSMMAQSYLAHPYHHPVIGWRSDVEKVPLARLRQFYNDFYYPNNATLVVIGDFKTAQALADIEKYFSKVPAAKNAFPKVYTTEPPQEGERRFTVRRGSDLPKVMMGFHSPEAVNSDGYALDVAASILGDDRKQSSRLYKALIDTNLASDCNAYNSELKDPSDFVAYATATPGTALDKVESTLQSELEKLATQPPSPEELDKAKKAVWKSHKIEAADPMGLANQLAEAIAVADWKWWVNLEKNIKAVTAADVQRVARKYFLKKSETVGYYYPAENPNAGESPAPSKLPAPAGYRNDGKLVPSSSSSSLENGAKHARINSEAAEKLKTGNRKLIAVATTTSAPRTSIASQVQKKVLPNGLTVLVMPVKGSGVVAVAGKLRAGDYFHPKDFYSVPDFTADMLDKGSKNLTKDALAQQLELMGTSLDFSASHFMTDFQSDIVREDLANYLGIVSDVLQNPLFPEDELEKEKKQRAAEIQSAMADTGSVASNAFYSSVYKDNCVYYRQPYKDQLAEIPKVNVEQLRAFHKSYIGPANMVLAVVGDVEPSEAFSLVEKNFSSWSGSPAPKIDVADCADAGIKSRTITNQMTDKANVEVLLGTPAAVSIKSKDFYAAQLANAALGHDTLSSRLAELRNKYGYTYGVSSYFSENAFENGPWVLNFTVNPENLNKALPVVHKIVDNFVKTGLTKQELDEEAKRLIGEYIIERMRTPRQLADALTKYEILGLGPKFMDEYAVHMREVTQEDANAAIKKYIVPSKLVTSIAGTLPNK
jgi:zinc protease